jgi:GAF domain-containing protein
MDDSKVTTKTHAAAPLAADNPSWDSVDALVRLARPELNQQPPQQRLQAALEQLQQVLGFDAATVYFYDRKEKRLVDGVSLDERVELVDFLNIGHGSGLSGWTVHDRRPLLLSSREADRGPSMAFQTFLSVPLLNGEEIYGALNIGCHKPQALDQNDVRLAELAGVSLVHLIRECEQEAQIDRLRNRLRKSDAQLVLARKGLDALEQLASASHMAGEVIHQINDPLSVVLGNTQCLVAEQGAVNQRGLRRLRRIEKAALRIAEVNRSLLEIYGLSQNNDEYRDPKESPLVR